MSYSHIVAREYPSQWRYPVRPLMSSDEGDERMGEAKDTQEEKSAEKRKQVMKERARGEVWK